MKHHILMLREHATGQAAWIRLEAKTTTEIDKCVGGFVMHALAAFREKCAENDVDPKFELLPLVMDQAGYDQLEDQTWTSEVEELIRDVERGSEE